MSPSVSVIIPVFNRPEWSLRAVNSVLQQSFHDFELIVVDDGSIADMSLVRKAVQENNGIYMRTENRGVAAARNLGAAHAHGYWLAFLDSDDQWLQEKLALQFDFLAGNPHLRICQTEELWYRHGRRVNPKKIHQQPEGEAFYQSLKLCCISPSSVMLTRELFLESKGFDERLKVCEDYDLWLRITAKEPVGLLRKALIIKHGGHEDQLSRSAPAMDRFRIFGLLKLCGEDYLNNSQRLAVFREIGSKAAVVAAGAKRRNLEARAELYDEIARHAGIMGNKNSDSAQKSLTELLGQVLADLKS